MRAGRPTTARIWTCSSSSRKLVDRYREMIRPREAVEPIGSGVDVLVYSEEEAERRGQVPGTVVYWAVKEGKVVDDAASE